MRPSHSRCAAALVERPAALLCRPDFSIAASQLIKGKAEIFGSEMILRRAYSFANTQQVLSAILERVFSLRRPLHSATTYNTCWHCLLTASSGSAS